MHITRGMLDTLSGVGSTGTARLCPAKCIFVSACSLVVYVYNSLCLMGNLIYPD